MPSNSDEEVKEIIEWFLSASQRARLEVKSGTNDIVAKSEELIEKNDVESRRIGTIVQEILKEQKAMNELYKDLEIEVDNKYFPSTPQNDLDRRSLSIFPVVSAIGVTIACLIGTAYLTYQHVFGPLLAGGEISKRWYTDMVMVGLLLVTFVVSYGFGIYRTFARHQDLRHQRIILGEALRSTEETLIKLRKEMSGSKSGSYEQGQGRPVWKQYNEILGKHFKKQVIKYFDGDDKRKLGRQQDGRRELKA